MGSLAELWPDDDRRDAAVEHLLARITLDDTIRAARGGPLTPKQREVLVCLSHGTGRNGAADLMGCNLETVKSHLRQLKRTLAAKDNAHAVAIAIRTGLIP